MTALPHDIADMMLAPVVLQIDARIQELSGLGKDALAYEIAITSDMADRTEEQRRMAVLAALSRHLNLHGWALEWDARGVRLRHGHSNNTLVLGVPEPIRAFVE